MILSSGVVSPVNLLGIHSLFNRFLRAARCPRRPIGCPCLAPRHDFGGFRARRRTAPFACICSYLALSCRRCQPPVRRPRSRSGEPMHDHRQPRPCQPADGARSRGPRTVAGKARSARNALKHGLRARRLLLLDREDAAEFRAFATRLQAALMPEGALQESLVSRIVIGAWRSRRADRPPPPSRAGPARALCRARQRRRSGPAGGARRRPDPGRPRRPRAGDIAPLSRLGPRRWFRALATLKRLQADAGPIDGPVPPSLPPPERV